MITMQPVIPPGMYHWDQALFPRAEFQSRVGRLQAIIQSRGWDGMIVYGDPNAAPLLTYLTNFSPRIRWTLALVPRAGDDVRLFLGVAPRDLKLSQELTWIPDAVVLDRFPEALPAWLAKNVSAVGRPTLAIAGLETMSQSAHRDVLNWCDGCLVTDGDADVATLWHVPSPSERTAIRTTCGILEKVARAVLGESGKGHGLTEAAIRAEQEGYRLGALDVRILTSPDSGRTFRPVQAQVNQGVGAGTSYVAIKNNGYWADGFVGGAPAEGLRIAVAEALGQLISGARTGGNAGGLAEILRGASQGLSIHNEVALVSRAGIAIDAMAPGEPFVEGGVVSIKFGLGDDSGGFAFASAVAVVSANEPTLLFDSRDVHAYA